MRIDAAFAVTEAHMTGRDFVADDRPTIADFSMMGYLFFPTEELGFEIAATYPSIHAWKQRIQALPGWVAPYDLLPSADMARR
jgi:glutathione S-transferase